MARGCSKIDRFDAGATLLDVNSAQPYFNESYREPSIILRIGLDLIKNNWCERIYMDGCQRLPKRIITGDIVIEHNRQFEKHGKILLGRFDSICPRTWNMIHSFLNLSSPRLGAKMLLILRRDKNYAGYTTRLFKLREECTAQNLVPDYYRDLIPDMYLWFEIGKLTPMNSYELAKYKKDIVYAVKRKKTISKTLVSAGY